MRARLNVSTNVSRCYQPSFMTDDRSDGRSFRLDLQKFQNRDDCHSNNETQMHNTTVIQLNQFLQEYTSNYHNNNKPNNLIPNILDTSFQSQLHRDKQKETDKNDSQETEQQNEKNWVQDYISEIQDYIQLNQNNCQSIKNIEKHGIGNKDVNLLLNQVVMNCDLEDERGLRLSIHQKIRLNYKLKEKLQEQLYQDNKQWLISNNWVLDDQKVSSQFENQIFVFRSVENITEIFMQQIKDNKEKLSYIQSIYGQMKLEYEKTQFQKEQGSKNQQQLEQFLKFEDKKEQLQQKQEQQSKDQSQQTIQQLYQNNRDLIARNKDSQKQIQELKQQLELFQKKQQELEYQVEQLYGQNQELEKQKNAVLEQVDENKEMIEILHQNDVTNRFRLKRLFKNHQKAQGSKENSNVNFEDKYYHLENKYLKMKQEMLSLKNNQSEQKRLFKDISNYQQVFENAQDQQQQMKAFKAVSQIIQKQNTIDNQDTNQNNNQNGSQVIDGSKQQSQEKQENQTNREVNRQKKQKTKFNDEVDILSQKIQSEYFEIDDDQKENLVSQIGKINSRYNRIFEQNQNLQAQYLKIKELNEQYIMESKRINEHMVKMNKQNVSLESEKRGLRKDIDKFNEDIDALNKKKQYHERELEKKQILIDKLQGKPEKEEQQGMNSGGGLQNGISNPIISAPPLIGGMPPPPPFNPNNNNGIPAPPGINNNKGIPAFTGGGIPPPPNLNGGGIPPPPFMGGGGIPPPPGFKGGIPGPPGFVGGGMIKPAAKKVQIIEKSKTKPLFWEKYQDGEINNSIWKDMITEEIKEIAGKIKFKDIEEYFGLHAKKKAVEEKPDAIKKKAVAKSIIPDSKRANNMNIALKKYTRKGLDVLKKAIVEMDPIIFNDENAMAIANFVPDEAEANIAKQFDGNVDEICDASKFIVFMKDVPLFAERCKYVVFMKDFPEKLEEVQVQVKIIQDACQSFEKSQKFKIFLTICLEVGNTMNLGSNRGAAKGFKISSLDAIQSCKSVENSTLMKYILNKIFEQQKEILSLTDDFDCLQKAQNIDLYEGIKELKGYSTDFKQLKDAIEKSKLLEDKFFIDKFGNFYENYFAQYNNLLKELSDINTMFMQTIKKLGENEKKYRNINDEGGGSGGKDAKDKKSSKDFFKQIHQNMEYIKKFIKDKELEIKKKNRRPFKKAAIASKVRKSIRKSVKVDQLEQKAISLQQEIEQIGKTQRKSKRISIKDVQGLKKDRKSIIQDRKSIIQERKSIMQERKSIINARKSIRNQIPSNLIQQK